MEVKESKEEVGSMKSNAAHIFIISPENITVRQDFSSSPQVIVKNTLLRYFLKVKI